jgi:hypothetical protein
LAFRKDLADEPAPSVKESDREQLEASDAERQTARKAESVANEQLKLAKRQSIISVAAALATVGLVVATILLTSLGSKSLFLETLA